VIRVALAALLAVALLGAATPAVGDARVSATDRRLRGDLGRLGTVAETLETRHDAVRPAAGPARRTVRLAVPGRGWARAPATVTVGAGPGNDRLAWRVGDGAGGSIRVGVELRVRRDGGSVGGGLRLGPGRYRLVLSLVRVDDRTVVTVRGFKADTGGNPPRVRAGLGGDGRVRV
jgi:hypothetical protein